MRKSIHKLGASGNATNNVIKMLKSNVQIRQETEIGRKMLNFQTLLNTTMTINVTGKA